MAAARLQEPDRGVSAAQFDSLVNRTYEAAFGESDWDELCDAIAGSVGWLRLRLRWQKSAPDPTRFPAGSWRHDTQAAGDESLLAEFGLPREERLAIGSLTRSRIILDDETGVALEALAAVDMAEGIVVIERLRPHLVRALTLQRERELRLERQRVAAWLLDSVPQAVAMVSADGTVAPCNRAWRRLFSGVDVPGANPPGTDTPGTDTPGTDVPGRDAFAALAKLLDPGRVGVAGGGEFAALIGEWFEPRPADSRRRRIWRTGKPGTSTDRLIIATAIPSRATDDDLQSILPRALDGRPRVLLIVHSPGAQEGVDLALLADTFDLTRTETTVARALAWGDQAQDIADTRFVSLHTIRTQMRMIYRKLGVRRQADLVRIISQLPRIDVDDPLRSSVLRGPTDATTTDQPRRGATS